MELRRIIYVLRAIGISGILRTFQYAYFRDRQERIVRLKTIEHKNVFPGNLKSITTITGGLAADYERAGAEIIFLTPNMIRISWSPGQSPVPYSLEEHDWIDQNPKYINIDHRHSLLCGKLAVEIDNDGGLSFTKNDGIILRHDAPPVQNGDMWSLSTLMSPEEHIYGLGERASMFNLRPGTYDSWNSDAMGSYSHNKDPLYIGTPIYLSLADSRSYLAYFENSSRSLINIAENLDITFSHGMLRYYLIFGSLEVIYSELGKLIGRSSLPPRWSLGYHQSRWGYQNEKDIRRVIQGFEDHQLPLSAIHLDIDYMDKFRVFTINRKRFPGIKQLATQLDGKGIKLVASLNPGVKLDPKYKVYQEGLSANAFCRLPDGRILHGLSWPGWCVFPDFTNPDCRTWWSKQYQALLSNGITGIWHDMNEPASFAAWGDLTLPQTTRHIMDGRGGDHREAHNLYGLLMNKAGFEALQEAAPTKRPWILSRSGWAGLQKYAWNWTGDVETSWDALKQTIPTILGLGLSGHAFSGVDIGGFSGNPDALLYMRWFQLATFLPFFRAHSAIGTKPREPWVFGEPFTSIVRDFLHLRYNLMPYLYTCAWESSKTGYPVIRPLFWDNPRERNLWDIEDEFLLGTSLLICPVLDEKAHIRKIILPPANWYSYWDDRIYEGPCSIDYSVTPETIPIFVKEGTVLPIEEKSKIIYHIYPSWDQQTKSQVYTDDGDGYRPGRIDTFSLSPGDDSLELYWDSTGDYSYPYLEINFQVHGKKLSKAFTDHNQCANYGNIIMTQQFKKLDLLFES